MTQEDWAKFSRHASIDAETPRWNATAQNILQSARRLLAHTDVGSMSLDLVATEARVSKRLVLYYFKSKAGLLEALIEWNFQDEALRRFYASLPEDEGRIHAVATGHQEMLSDEAERRSYQEYLTMALHMVREPSSRATLARILATYRDLNAYGVSGGAKTEDVMALGAMTLALSDGLALQALAEPGVVDTERVWRLWETVATAVIEQSESSGGDR